MTSPTPTAAAPAPRRTRSPGSQAVAWIGVLVIAGGLVSAIAGGALAALFGADGALQSGRHAVSTSTAALVSAPAAVDATDGATEVLGATRLRVFATPAGGKPVFVGVARTADVDRYLRGVAVDRVTDFDSEPFRLEVDRQTGSAGPVAAPAAQRFWVAAATSGRSGTARLDWKVRDGSYRFVVMNADGSPQVRTLSSVGIKVPHMALIGLGMALVGLIAAGGGAALLRRR